MYHRLLVPALCALLVAGCAATGDQTKVVVLKHPETLDFQQCSVDDWGSREGFAQKDRCVQQWQEQGYVIWGAQ